MKESRSILFVPDVPFSADHCLKCVLQIHQASGPGEGQNVAGWKAASRATVVQLCQICPPTTHLTKFSTTSHPNEGEKIEKTGQELKMRESCVCVCLCVCLCDLMMPKLQLKEGKTWRKAGQVWIEGVEGWIEPFTKPPYAEDSTTLHRNSLCKTRWSFSNHPCQCHVFGTRAMNNWKVWYHA